MTNFSEKRWILVDKQTGDPVRVGDDRETFRGEKVRVTYLHGKHKESSSGKVSVQALYQPWKQTVYPGVIGCEYIEDNPASILSAPLDQY